MNAAPDTLTAPGPTPTLELAPLPPIAEENVTYIQQIRGRVNGSAPQFDEAIAGLAEIARLHQEAKTHLRPNCGALFQKHTSGIARALTGVVEPDEARRIAEKITDMYKEQTGFKSAARIESV